MILLRRQTVPIMESQVACSHDVVDEVVVNRSASIRLFFRETYSVRTYQKHQKTTIAHLKDASFILLTVDSQQSFWYQEYVYILYIGIARVYYYWCHKYHIFVYMYVHSLQIGRWVPIYIYIIIYTMYIICYYIMTHSRLILIYYTLFNSIHIYIYINYM